MVQCSWLLIQYRCDPDDVERAALVWLWLLILSQRRNGTTQEVNEIAESYHEIFPEKHGVSPIGNTIVVNYYLTVSFF